MLASTAEREQARPKVKEAQARMSSYDSHTIELRSMTFTLSKTRINSVLRSLNHAIRHKPLHNIPLMQGFLQLSVILQRQKTTNKSKNPLK